MSTVIVDTDATRLGRAIRPRVEGHPGDSGIYALPDAREAFAARVLLAQAADKTLDVEYYIWRNDMAGVLLFEALRRAADRGVRVRLLLDDNNTSGLDTTLAALDAHPNIEVRLFNPFVIRSARSLGYVTDFFRANRRMHNKSFTADNQATIIGGRNVGDEYFGAAESTQFVDLDVLAVGPVVNAVSGDFDRYWASESSYPVRRLLPRATSSETLELARAAARVEGDPAAQAYVDVLRNSGFVNELVRGSLALEWAATRLVSDDPAKGLGRAAPDALLPHKLRSIIGEPAAHVALVSPYFVPTAAGVEAFAAMARRGVSIKVFTNSLEATDVPVVHSGYAKRRKALLEAGVTLFELRRLSPRPEARKSAAFAGSSSSSLHAKTFAVDRSRVFIGSFNFDPRSSELNTEMGFVIESPALAQRIEAAFDGGIAANAYRVYLSDAGRLCWVERQEGQLVRHDTEPGTTLLKRAGVWLMSLLPIESLL